MPEVIMPKMGDAMDAGTLSTWLKSEGDEVEIGDVLAEIETDKATMELTAEDAGILQEIIAGEGVAVPVGEAIAVIVGEGEEAPPRREARQAEDGARGNRDGGPSARGAGRQGARGRGTRPVARGAARGRKGEGFAHRPSPGWGTQHRSFGDPGYGLGGAHRGARRAHRS